MIKVKQYLREIKKKYFQSVQPSSDTSLLRVLQGEGLIVFTDGKEWDVDLVLRFEVVSVSQHKVNVRKIRNVPIKL